MRYITFKLIESSRTRCVGAIVLDHIFIVEELLSRWLAATARKCTIQCDFDYNAKCLLKSSHAFHRYTQLIYIFLIRIIRFSSPRQCSKCTASVSANVHAPKIRFMQSIHPSEMFISHLGKAEKKYKPAHTKEKDISEMKLSNICRFHSISLPCVRRTRRPYICSIINVYLGLQRQIN